MSTIYRDLTLYLANTVAGTSMRELARTHDVEPSTICRTVRRVEELREWPEWDAVLDQLALVTCPDGVTDEAVLTAMGVERDEAEVGFLEAMTVLSQAGSALAVTHAPVACVFLDGEVAYRTTKRLATTWLALGWLRGSSNGKVRRYVPSGRYGQPEEPVAEAKPRRQPRPYAQFTHESSDNIAYMRRTKVGAKGSRFGFTNDQVNLAIDLSTLMTSATCRGANSPELSRVIQLKERLGDELFNVLHDFLHAGHGLEQIEKTYGFPARSAKVLLGVALQQIMHFGLDEGLTVMGGADEGAEGAEGAPNPAVAASGSGGRSVRPLHAAE